MPMFSSFARRFNGFVLRALLVLIVLVSSGQRSYTQALFNEDFSASALVPDWQVVAFGNSSYSLTESPGSLRYHVDGYTTYTGGWSNNYDASNWQPSTTLIRPFDGDSWKMHIKISWNVHGYWGSYNSTGAQGVRVYVPFGSGTSNFVQIYRHSDWFYSANYLGAGITNGGNFTDGPLPAPPVGPDGYYRDTYWWEVARHGLDITVGYSTDGVSYQTFLTGQLGPSVETSNRVIIDGTSYLPFGTYADIDFINVSSDVPSTDTTPPTLTVPGDITACATGPGGAVVTFAAPTATDDMDPTPTVTCDHTSGSVFPLGTTIVKCQATDSAGNTANDSFIVSVTYQWSGVLQPINVDGTSVFKLGSTVPVKFQLTGCSAGITSAAAKLSYAKVSNGVAGPVNEAVSTASATTGNLFRYDSSSDQYIFNWSTKGLTAGSYQLQIDLGDGVSHTINVGLK